MKQTKPQTLSHCVVTASARGHVTKDQLGRKFMRLGKVRMGLMVRKMKMVRPVAWMVCHCSASDDVVVRLSFEIVIFCEHRNYFSKKSLLGSMVKICQMEQEILNKNRIFKFLALKTIL